MYLVLQGILLCWVKHLLLTQLRQQSQQAGPILKPQIYLTHQLKCIQMLGMLFAQPRESRQGLLKLTTTDLQLRLGNSNGHIRLGRGFIGLTQQVVALTVVFQFVRGSGSGQIIDQR